MHRLVSTGLRRTTSCVPGRVYTTKCVRFFATPVPVTMIQELRKITSAGMMDCKKALETTNNNLEEAIKLIQEKSKKTATKLGGREAQEGVIACHVQGNKGLIMELNSETDFVSKGATFQDLAKRISKAAVESKQFKADAKLAPVEVSQILETEMTSEAKTVALEIENVIGQLRENIKLRRSAAAHSQNGVIGAYSHGGSGNSVGRIGALVTVESGSKDEKSLNQIASRLAAQVAGLTPKFLSKNEVPQSFLEEKLKDDANNSEKQKELYEDSVLLEQKMYDSESDETVSQVLQKESQKLGSEVKITSFIRYAVGEGMEKKKDDFAEQVQEKMKTK